MGTVVSFGDVMSSMAKAKGLGEVGLSYITIGQTIVPITTDGKLIKRIKDIKINQSMNSCIEMILTVQVHKYENEIKPDLRTREDFNTHGFSLTEVKG